MELLSGRRRGPLADLLRGALTLFSWLYLGVILVRNALYDSLPLARRAKRPVISIGNLTTGGTGKTPLAIHVAHALAERGRRVALLTRGYKGRPVRYADEDRDAARTAWRVESDEAMLLKRLCPQAAVHIDPNRARAAQRAIEQGADVLVLDDGFQHRRLARDLDLVLIDALNPFGFGHLLPRGLLREPVRALRRADLLVLTRADEISPPDRDRLTTLLHDVSRGRPLLACRHRIVGFVDVKGRAAPDVDARAMQAVVFAGIGHFEPFVASVERLGARVVAAYRYPDHHDYADDELAQLPDVAARVDANVIVTTEKDAVKLVGRWRDGPVPLLAARLALEFDGDDAARLSDALGAALERSSGRRR